MCNILPASTAETSYEKRPYAAVHTLWGVHSPSQPGPDAYVYALSFSLLCLRLPYIINFDKIPLLTETKLGNGRR